MTAMASRTALATLLLLASGCAAGLPASRDGEIQVRCENTGGRWHAATARAGFCEYQSPGMI